jgi:CubicO group peptidase (beta-lactamase class C family)
MKLGTLKQQSISGARQPTGNPTRTRRAGRAAAALLALAAAWGTIAFAEPAQDSSISRVETGLLPAVIVAGKPNPPLTIAEQMGRYNVPAVGIAVIEGGEIKWTRSYGEQTPGSAPATERTLFQAASISKPLAAAAALRLVYEKKVALDEPVNKYLSSWKVPDSEFAPGNSVTLRRLLSHSAGLSVSGFDGYVPGKPSPSVRQVLDGEAPANSQPVRITQAPGKWRYSGGGYTVVQQLIEDVTKRPFGEALQSSILTPLGLTASSFEQPLSRDREPLAAIAHNAKGEALEGRWHVYPELAAAGLWSTPRDLARFGLWVMQGIAGERASALQKFVARGLVEPQPGLDRGNGERAGLGLSMRGEGRSLEFRHDGQNAGYFSILVAFPETGQGAVIMTNGDRGWPLVQEILRSIAAEYRWPARFVELVTPVRVERAKMEALAGSYSWGAKPNERITIAVAEEELTVRMGPGEPAPLLAIDERTFISRRGIRLQFEGEKATIKLPSGDPIVATREGAPKQ